MTKPGGSSADDRRRRLEEVQRAGTKREVKRVLLYIAAGAVPVLLIGVLMVVLTSRADKVDSGATGSGDAAGPPADLSAVQKYEVVADHVTDPVDYPQSPPVGGAHNPIWLNCGSYGFQPPSENAVHSMEHGAVWITYRSDTAPVVVDTIKAAVPATYVIVSPYDDQTAPVVASAWGRQLVLDSATDPRLADFIAEYRLGGIAPEAGASCDGASDGTLPLDAAEG